MSTERWPFSWFFGGERGRAFEKETDPGQGVQGKKAEEVMWNGRYRTDYAKTERNHS